MAEANSEPETLSLAEKIRRVFLARPGEDLDIDAVFSAIDGGERSAVMFALSGLTKRGFIYRTGKGVYRFSETGVQDKAETRRARSAERAERAQDRADHPQVAPAARTAGARLGGKAPDLTVVGKLRGGKVLLEDTEGGLWAAVRLVEEVRR